jgi:asparagine synthase (glutamine-hydrolysing)
VVADSVRHHLVADVPVGVFLSAGIDSSVIAELACEHGARIQTVTLAFAEYAGTDADEAPLAEATARTLGTEHVTVRIDRDEFEGLLDDFMASMDQPTIDGLNTYLVSRAAAAQGLKVVLSGLGGDELFGGYPSFRQIPKLLGIGSRFGALSRFGPPLRSIVRALAPRRLHPKAAGLFTHHRDLAHAYFLRRALHLEDELDLLLDESWRIEGLARLSTIPQLDAMTAELRGAGVGPHAQIAVLESCWYMRNQLLRDTDWSSMAHGLEVRVPYVDAVLLQRLGPAVASSAPPTKNDLASCAHHVLPGIFTRTKTGFTTPVRDWVAGREGSQPRGLRGWAGNVHRRFRIAPGGEPAPADMMAAA